MRTHSVVRWVCVLLLAVTTSGEVAKAVEEAELHMPAEVDDQTDSEIKAPKLSTLGETSARDPIEKKKAAEAQSTDEDDFLEHGSTEEKLPQNSVSANVTGGHSAAKPTTSPTPVVPERFEDAAAGLQKDLQELLKEKEPAQAPGGASDISSATGSTAGTLQQQLEQVLQSVGNSSGIVQVQRVEDPMDGGKADADKPGVTTATADEPKQTNNSKSPNIMPHPVKDQEHHHNQSAPQVSPSPGTEAKADSVGFGPDKVEKPVGPPVVFLKGQLGESCTDACERAGKGKLKCIAAQLPAANDCAMLDRAFGCGGEGKCLAVPGIDKPAAVLLPGAQTPLCFLHQGFAASPPGAEECDAQQHMSARLCPCTLTNVPQDGTEVDAVLSAAKAAEPGALEAEREKVLAMARAVDVLIKQYNGTAASLAATQARLERLRAIDHAEAEIAGIMRAVHSHKIDYETGKVTMPDGSKMSYGAAMSRLKELQAITKLKSQEAKEDEQHEHGADGGENKPPVPPRTANPPPPTPAEENKVLLPAPGDEIAVIDPAILRYDMELLQDMGVLLCVGAVGGVFFSFVGLPPSFGFLLMGMAAGPNGWDAIRDTAGVSSVAQFGVVFPLFLNGMQFGLKFKNAAALSSLAAQSTIITAVVFTGLAMAAFAILGITKGPGEGVLMGLALSLASPAVSIANLIDHGKLGSTGGQVTLAMLAVQDLIMGFMLSLPHALGVLAAPEDDEAVAAAASAKETGDAGFMTTHARELKAAMLLMRSAVSLLGMVLLIYLWSRGVFRRLMARMGLCSANTCPGVVAEHKRDEELSPEQKRTSEEVFLLGLVGACMIGALSTEAMGLSLEMGAFLAGLVLSSTSVAPVSRLVAAVMPLSRLFSAMFLASVGLVLSPVFLWHNLGMLLLALALLMSAKAAVLYVVLRSFRLSSGAAVVATVAMSSMAEVGLAFTGKAHAMGLISRYCYLLMLSTVVLSTLASPLLHRAQHHIQRVLHYLDCGAQGVEVASDSTGSVNYAAVPAGVNVAEADFRSPQAKRRPVTTAQEQEPVFQAVAVHASARGSQRDVEDSRMRAALHTVGSSEELSNSDHLGGV